MATDLQQLIAEVHRLAVQLPDEVVIRLASALANASVSDWQRLRILATNAVPQPAARDHIAAFLDHWQAAASQTGPESVALALLTAVHSEEYHRKLQGLELVWTGPDSKIIPLRRTDQALLQLINESRVKLTIVSFAVYKVEAITKALARAARRGVQIAVCLETPDASEGKIAFDTIKALGEEVARSAQIYIWPLVKRPQSPDGRYGSLHAKFAVADGTTLLVSSANLTDYAMTLNMEMGVLIHGGDLPTQVEEHIETLIDDGVLRAIS
jgi:phosphatidylserine/phosphatidylglycerophosphate/cardiolipin synthase-like enzyme